MAAMEVEPPRNIFGNHAMYLAINVTNAPFSTSKLYWKSTKKQQFLKARRKCSWFAGSKYCIERK